jgi:hypothetical protein
MIPSSAISKMGHLNTRTCLSTEKHDDRVLDVTLHYFGCLKAPDRQEYFAALPEKSKKRIVEEKSRVRHHRSYFEAYPDTEAGSALKNFKATLSEWRRLNHKQDPDIVRSASLDKRIDVNVEKEVKASVIYFKDSRPYDVPGVGNSFPNQKISVAELLAENEDSNPLMQPCKEGMIRYFHLPANNMLWVEVGTEKGVCPATLLNIYRKPWHDIIVRCGLHETSLSGTQRALVKATLKCFSPQSIGLANKKAVVAMKCMHEA